MRLSTFCLLAALGLMSLASIFFGGDGGGGATVSVSPAQAGVAGSRAAEEHNPPGARAGASVPTRVNPAAPVARAASPTPAGGAALDGSLEAALRAAVPAGPGFVMLSFANSALNDHLINFVSFAKRASAPFVIGAIDEAAFTMLAARGDSPTYLTPLATGGV